MKENEKRRGRRFLERRRKKEKSLEKRGAVQEQIRSSITHQYDNQSKPSKIRLIGPLVMSQKLSILEGISDARIAMV